MHQGPFEQHLREAIELNRERAPLYAELSGGASLGLSRALIRSERMLLPFARWLDRRAERYHRAGVPVLEEMFVPMSGALPFLPHRPPAGAPGGGPRPQPGRIRQRVMGAYRREGFAGAGGVLAAELDAIAAHPQHDCMLRHMLESALRICTLAPLHEERAREKGLPSPRWMSALLLRMHLLGLGSAVRMDRRARPLQERGIAILYQDLPPIPPGPV